MNNPSPKKTRRQVRTTDQKAAKQLRAAAPAWVPELEKWEQAEYDGLKGWPPEWVPEPQREQFRLNRTCLFFLVEEKKATYTEIRSRFDYLAQNKYGAIVLALLRDAKPYDDDLRRLVTLYQASSLEPEEGLRRLAGEASVAGFRARTGYQKRKAALHKPEVQKIGKAYWDSSPKATVKDILNSREFHSYMKGKKPYADRTIQNWLREIDPRPLSSKRGPRSRKR